MRHLLAAAVFAAIVFQYPATRAEVRSRNEVGVGFTNNANLEQTNTDSDLFLKLSTSNSLRQGEHDLGLRLSFLGYAHEKTNDVFAWRLSDRVPVGRAGWELYGAFGGQTYTQGDPGTTDASFDNLSFDLAGEKSVPWGEKTEFSFGPGYQMLYYTSFDNRSDHTFFVAFAVDHEATKQLALGARAEIGLVASTQADYSKSYFEFGGAADYALNRDWVLSGDLAIRQSYFLNRTVSTRTVSSNRRGVTSTSTLTSLESYSRVWLGGEAMREWNRNVRTGFGLNLVSQGSKSGYQDYSAAELMARALIVF